MKVKLHVRRGNIGCDSAADVTVSRNLKSPINAKNLLFMSHTGREWKLGRIIPSDMKHF